MHCHGCKNLIKLSLEELQAVQNINVKEGEAKFESNAQPADLKLSLDHVFRELPGYFYTNLERMS